MIAIKNLVTAVPDHHFSHATLFSFHDKLSDNAADTTKPSFVAATMALDKITTFVVGWWDLDQVASRIVAGPPQNLIMAPSLILRYT